MSSSNPNTDEDIINDRTPGTDPDLDVSQSASAGSGVNPLAGTQGSDADTHNGGRVPVAGYTPDQLGQPSAGGSENRLGNLGRDARARDTAAAPGPAGTANQTGTTIGENYTGGPIQADPEEQLLDPGYEPDIPDESDRRTATPGRPSFADNPNLGGMPNQQGQQDQTTYNDRGQRT